MIKRVELKKFSICTLQEMFNQFPREELRSLAKNLNIKQGRNKADTVRALSLGIGKIKTPIKINLGIYNVWG